MNCKSGGKIRKEPEEGISLQIAVTSFGLRVAGRRELETWNP